ncbi:uncharacterized protein VDAG_05239 [Verticillium dahliae VdLs.17]|uniref:Uncharacterized protein n=2 Tax=Verticillium dahliae TaxID=27337 RepID=G2X507_VERDV|nr:uncharacterized protein VDAG_05239 [Verticillium dahliae VdLs.17]EGY23801.1 hypothetical protein VDAG_05239 [Verticillium dahliae VdLs.17]
MVYRDRFFSAKSQLRDMYPESAAISCLELLVEEGRDTVVLHLLQHGFHPHHMLTSRILNLVSGTHGSSPHLTDINPLHISAAMGLQKVAALLIGQHGTHVDFRDSCGYTPLSYAIRSPFADDEMISELILCGADLMQEVPHGGIQVSILEYACHAGRFTAALHILDALELSDVPFAYDPALRVTIPMPCFQTKGQTSHTKKILVSKLLGRGANPNAIVRSSGAPLLTHLVRNHPTAVDFLLALPGVLVDTPDESGHTALAYALSPRTQPSPVYLKVAVSLLAHKATLTTTMTKWILDGTRCISTMRHMKKTLERGPRLLDFFRLIYGHCIEVPQWQRTHAQQYFLAEAPEWTVHLTCRKKSKGLWTRRVVESKVNKYFDLKIVPRGSAMSLSAPVQYLEPSNDEAPTVMLVDRGQTKRRRPVGRLIGRLVRRPIGRRKPASAATKGAMLNPGKTARWACSGGCVALSSRSKACGSQIWSVGIQSVRQHDEALTRDALFELVDDGAKLVCLPAGSGKGCRSTTASMDVRFCRAKQMRVFVDGVAYWARRLVKPCGQNQFETARSALVLCLRARLETLPPLPVATRPDVLIERPSLLTSSAKLGVQLRWQVRKRAGQCCWQLLGGTRPVTRSPSGRAVGYQQNGLLPAAVGAKLGTRPATRNPGIARMTLVEVTGAARPGLPAGAPSIRAEGPVIPDQCLATSNGCGLHSVGDAFACHPI